MGTSLNSLDDSAGPLVSGVRSSVALAQQMSGPFAVKCGHLSVPVLVAGMGVPTLAARNRLGRSDKALGGSPFAS